LIIDINILTANFAKIRAKNMAIFEEDLEFILMFCLVIRWMYFPEIYYTERVFNYE